MLNHTSLVQDNSKARVRCWAWMADIIFVDVITQFGSNLLISLRLKKHFCSGHFGWRADTLELEDHPITISLKFG